MTAHSAAAPKLSGIDRFFARIEDGMNLIAAGSIFLLMILAAVQVLGRKLFNLPIPGYIDFAEQSIAIFAFMGAAYCQRIGAHVRMELFLDKFGRGRMLWLAETFTTAAATLVVGILTYFSFTHFLRAFQNGDSTIDINLPVWPSKLLVCVALGFLTVRLLIQLAGFLRLVGTPAAVPVAVPLVGNVVEHAQQEIDAGLADESVDASELASTSALGEGGESGHDATRRREQNKSEPRP